MTSLTTNNKRIAKNTLLLYIRSILLIVISLYTSRVVLEVLGVDNYGIYNLVGGVVAMFSMLSGSMATASQRFITYSLGEGNDKVEKVFSTSMTIHLLLGIFLAIILEIGGCYLIYNFLNIPVDRLTAAIWVLHCSVFAFFINVISIPYNALIIAYEKMAAFAYISILEAILKLLSVFILIFISFDKLIGYALFISSISLIQRLVYSIYCKRNFNEARNISIGVDKYYFRKMFAFAGWNLWGSGSLVLRNQGIDILLNLFFGVTINAAKGICNQVQNAIYQFVTNFQTAIVPQLTKSIALKEYVRAHGLIFQGSRFSFYLLSVLSIPLLLVTPQILSLWLVEVPEYTIEFVRLTLIYLLLDSLSRCLINAIQAEGNIRNYQVLVGGTKILTLPLAYLILILGGSPLTGIWANIIIEVVCLFLRLYFVRKSINFSVFKYLKGVVLHCWSVFLISVFILLLIKKYITDNVFFVVIISFCLSSLFIYCLGLTSQERCSIIRMAKSIFTRSSHE